MKISVLAMGTEGDVRPYIALGIGLKRAGYEVYIATHKMFEQSVRGSGLGFFSVRHNPIDILKSNDIQTSIERNEVVRSWLLFAKTIKPYLVEWGSDLFEASKGSDAIVYSHTGFPFGPHIAEKLKVPSIPAFLAPLYPTRSFPSLITQRNLGGFGNLFTWFIGDLLSWLPFRSTINHWRKEDLNLPPIPIHVNYRKKWREMQKIILLGISPNVLSKPIDWEDHIHLTGYWFPPDYFDKKSLDELAKFISSGSTPVYIGFGSFALRKAEEITDVILEALSLSNQRAVVATGWGGLKISDIRDHVFTVTSVPHGWLFEQVAAVIHHGGAGTTANGLMAGVPSIVVPFYLDQFFWGKLVADLGVGPSPIPIKKLTARRLSNTITHTLSNEQIKKNATNLAQRIRGEDGVSRAVEIIHDYLSSL